MIEKAKESKTATALQHSLSNKITRLRKKGPEKQSSFEEFFAGKGFATAIESIRHLSDASGLQRLNPVHVARYVKKMLPFFPDGFELEDFISLIFIFF